MGPPPFGDGKIQLERSVSGLIGWLQWGHRLSAMERFQEHRQGVLGKLASMGPPPFGDWKEFSSSRRRGKFHRLQWGHRLSAMERTGACLGWE